MQENSNFLPSDAIPFFLKERSLSKKLIFVSSSHSFLEEIHLNLEFLGVNVCGLYPKFSHYINHDGLNSQQFLQAYYKAFESQQQVTLLHSSILTMPLPEPTSYSSLKIQKGQEIPLLHVADFLHGGGYINVGTVYNVFEFAVRGYIIDFATSEGFFRVEYFGNKIEEIKIFEPDTQRSLESISSVEIFTNTFLPKYLLNFQNFALKYQLTFQEENPDLMFAIENHPESCDVNRYAKLLTNTVNILEILEGDVFLHNATIENVLNYKDILFFEERNNIKNGCLYFKENQVLELLKSKNIQTLPTL